MTENRQFKTGEILFQEGDRSEHVLHITRGSVEISRLLNGDPIILGHVTEGQFLGEMAAIENRPHSATARAACDGEAEVIAVRPFLERVSHDAALAHELILRLSVRLRTTDDKVLRGQSPEAKRLIDSSEVGPVPAGAELAISARTAVLRASMGSKPIPIAALPFVVGRARAAREADPQRRPDLLIKDKVPFRLSRDHFMIFHRHGRFIVHDMSSTLGTIVNGHAIGRHFASDDAELRTGENVIMAGGMDSPFEFAVSVG